LKITKTTWIAIAVGVVVIGGISLFTALNQQSAQKAELQKKLDEAKQKLALADNEKLLAQRDQLNQQIQEFNAQTAEVKAQLSYPKDNIDITQYVIVNAVNCRVELLDLRSPGPGVETLGGVQYETMSMIINARGTTGTISDFVYGLKKVFPTCVIKSLSLNFTPSTVIPAHDGESPENLAETTDQTEVMETAATAAATAEATAAASAEAQAAATTTATAGATGAMDDLVTISINMVFYNYKGD